MGHASRHQNASVTRRAKNALTSDPEFNTHLNRLVSAQGRLSAGRLEVISLSKVREHVEGDWDAFADKVRSVITATIVKRLGPNDSFTQTDNDSYVIIFDNLTKEDAELECVLIVQEVLRTLFVDRNLDDRVDIRSVAVGVDGKVDVEQVDLLDIISRLLKEEQEVIERKRNAGHAHADANDMAIALVDAEKRKPAPKHRKNILDLDSVTSRLPRDIVFQYTPYWDVRRKVLSVYSCAATDGQNAGYDILGHEPDPQLVPALDCLVIGRVLHEMRLLHEKNTRLLICCPVHINTLSDLRAWGTYRPLCERFARDGLKKDLIFEIFGVDKKTDTARIIYCASKLEPFCKHTIIRTGLSDVDFRNFSSGAFNALSADVATFKGSGKRQMKLMDEYVESVRRMKLNAYITGLGKLSHVTAAIGSGFCKISGPVVHKPIDKPEFVFRFELQNLLDQLVA